LGWGLSREEGARSGEKRAGFRSLPKNWAASQRQEEALDEEDRQEKEVSVVGSETEEAGASEGFQPFNQGAKQEASCLRACNHA